MGVACTECGDLVVRGWKVVVRNTGGYIGSTHFQMRKVRLQESNIIPESIVDAGGEPHGLHCPTLQLGGDGGGVLLISDVRGQGQAR